MQNIKMAVANGLSGYKVGEISQVLLSKQREKKKGGKENAKLSALFSSANVIQPQFVSLTKLTKVSLRSFILVYRGFARQPCCMAGTIDSFSYGNKCSF